MFKRRGSKFSRIEREMPLSWGSMIYNWDGECAASCRLQLLLYLNSIFPVALITIVLLMNIETRRNES